MNKSILTTVVSVALLAAAQPSPAGEVTGLTSFTAGTPAVASQVNGNFTAVKTAVDNNHARITTLESSAASPNITGNITLAPSTATAGNILKGTTPFIHDYGTGNTFLGENAGNFTMTGHSNTANGMSALNSNTTGFWNTASGMNALSSNTTGIGNTANGMQALQLNTTGGSNTASGMGALAHNTTGYDNTASGALALRDNTTGFSNTASGTNALSSNMSGFNNTASGLSALNSNTSGAHNTASGVEALYNNTIGHFNTASGLRALFDNTTGGANTASGTYALSSNTTGSTNTANGADALLHNTTGSGNIAIGYLAGVNLTTGSNNIAIDNVGAGGESDTIRIGDSQTRTFIAGIRGVTTVNANAIPVVIDSAGQLGTVSSSRRFKEGIADMGEGSSVLMKLRPVSFYYKADKNPQGRSLQYGLVAEEVARVAPGLVARSSDGEIETVYYQHLTPMLLNEYQKQQRTIEAQGAMLTRQTARIAALEKQAAEVAELRQQLVRVTAALSRRQQPDRIAAVGRQ
jgi:hypothetical protein